MRHALLLPLLLGCVFLTQCGCHPEGRRAEKEPAADARVDEVEAEYDRLQAKAAVLDDEATGWIELDCDAMIWEGQRAAVSRTDSGTPLLAEYPNEPGRFNRRPAPCWTSELGDVGSETTWSRDMAVAGLLPYAWLKRRLDVMERHRAYGRDHTVLTLWRMGEPLSDGRVLYSPALSGVVAQVINALGGDAPERQWDNTYTSGLHDFEGHLQVMDIWLRGDISHATEQWDDCPNKNAPAGSISETMFKRLEEHASDEPTNPKFAAVLGKYTGDMSPAISNLLNGGTGSYTRCGEPCDTAERMFAAWVILRQYGRL